MKNLLVVGIAAVSCVVCVSLAASAGEDLLEPAAEKVLESGEQQDRVVAYYFHGNRRCSTCRKLEVYSKEAIENGFAEELASGRLEWRVVNVDEAANKHFVDDFQLVTKALVLVEYRDGDVARFKDLKLIWNLVHDKDGYLTYVAQATTDFLHGE